MVRGMIAGQQSTNPVMKYWNTDPHQHFLLRVADFTVLVGSDRSVKLRVEGKKENFIVHNGVPDVTIRAAWGELSDNGLGNILFDAGSVWQLYQQDGFSR